jgi:short chain dehydrogenase
MMTPTAGGQYPGRDADWSAWWRKATDSPNSITSPASAHTGISARDKRGDCGPSTIGVDPRDAHRDCEGRGKRNRAGYERGPRRPRDRIVLADRDIDRARAEESRLAETGGAVEASELDVTDPAAVESFVAEVAEAGDLAGLVNAAGVLQLGTIADVSVEDWDRVVDVNLGGTFLTCRAVIPHLEARGAGAIVNLASIAGRTKSFYGAPKLRGVERRRDRADDGPCCPTCRGECPGELRGPRHLSDPYGQRVHRRAMGEPAADDPHGPGR